MRFNRRHDFSGHLFGGRHKAHEASRFLSSFGTPPMEVLFLARRADGELEFRGGWAFPKSLIR